jgi:HPt (histidine-containing phosphotransfer) domain-containing protein
VNIPDDPFVRELLPEFVDQWIQDIDSQFQGLISSKNEDELYRFGHTLKGSCFQFGLDDVAEMGIKLMGLAREAKFDEAATMETQIRGAFETVKKEIEG